MVNKFRIEDVELLQKSHFPVKALFDMVSDERFVKVVEGISKGTGFGENYGACIFWNDLDDYDKVNIEKYEGAEFGLNNGEEITIGYQDIFYYLKIICDKYCKKFPENSEQINIILNNYKEKYAINT